MKPLNEKIVAAFFVIAVALQTWTLKEVVALKVAVAKIETRIQANDRRASEPLTSLPFPK